MQEWIRKVTEHEFPFNLVTIIPQAVYADSAASAPFSSAVMEYVVVVGFNPVRNEYCMGRVWRKTVESGSISWDNGTYIRNTESSVWIRVMSEAALKAQF